jgi:hypothetical protein
VGRPNRARYPQAQPDALARLAVAEHVRAARWRALTNTTGVGSLSDVGMLARTHASLILTVAAAYGSDPTAEARVRDLLELLPVPRLTQPTLAAAGNVGRVFGAFALRRIAARVLPFGAPLPAWSTVDSQPSRWRFEPSTGSAQALILRPPREAGHLYGGKTYGRCPSWHHNSQPRHVVVEQGVAEVGDRIENCVSHNERPQSPKAEEEQREDDPMMALPRNAPNPW